MELLAGTSGYSYKEWKGSFYPEKLPADGMLRYYAERFPTVEINNTFYRMPGEGMLSRWADEVPADFAFTLKAPRRITHDKRLKDTAAEVGELLRRAARLGSKLGPLLFQLPPSQRKDLAVLGDFLDGLPPGRQIAFEFRHPTWQDEEVYEALRSHDAMLCAADTDEGETPPLVATARFGYLRLRRAAYSDRDLKDWVKRIAAQPWERAYVYFKHEDEGLGPKFAARFARLWEAARGTGKKASR
jgi:uncharacterized protein YecE (DUF72 family)